MSGKINWADIARKAAPEPPKTAKPASPPPEPELPKLDSNGQVVASKPKPKPEPRPDPHTLFNAELPNMGNTAPVVAPKGAWGKKPAAAPTAAAGSGKQPAAVAADESAAGADGEQTKAAEQAATEEKKQKQPRAVEAVDPNLVPLDKRDEDNVKVEKKKGKKRAPQTSSPPPEAPASQPEATSEEAAASDAAPAAEVHAEPEPVPEPEPVREAEKTPQPAALEPAVIESPQRPVAHHADPHHRPAAAAAASAVVEPPRRENDSMETSSPFHQPPDMVGAWSDVPTPAFDFNLNPTNFGFGAYQNNQAHAEPQSAPLHPRLHVAEHLSKAFARRNETKVQLRAPHREPEAPSELQRRADDLATRERDLSRREADLTKARHEVDVKLHSLKAREGELEAQRREVAAEKLRLEQERKAHGEQVSAHDAQRTRELREIQQQREAINRERVQVAPPQPEVPYGRGAPAAHEGYGHGEPRQSTWHGPAMSGRDHHSHHAHHHHHHAHHQYQQDEVDYYGYSAGYQHPARPPPCAAPAAGPSLCGIRRLWRLRQRVPAAFWQLRRGRPSVAPAGPAPAAAPAGRARCPRRAELERPPSPGLRAAGLRRWLPRPPRARADAAVVRRSNDAQFAPQQHNTCMRCGASQHRLCEMAAVTLPNTKLNHGPRELVPLLFRRRARFRSVTVWALVSLRFVCLRCALADLLVGVQHGPQHR
jgi:hypothetical protein